VWALAAVGLMYLLLINWLEDISFMEEEIDDVLDIEDGGHHKSEKDDDSS
jgi:hypothetical protein